MRTRFVAAIISILWCGVAAPASADDICEAVALRPVAAVGNPAQVLKPGELDKVITQYRVDKKTSLVTLCSHGGSCYPMQIMENGVKVEVLHLTNCKVGKRQDFDDPDDVYYDLDVIRSKIAPTALKVDDLDNKLLDMGLCSACAHDAAYLYVHRPRSRCAGFVKRALAGNAAALAALTGRFEASCPTP